MTIKHVQSIVDVPAIADEAYTPVTLGKHFQITAAGLTVTGEPDFELCDSLWEALKTLERTLAFAIGDAIIYFEARFGEKASQIIDASGLADETCRVYRWLAKQVPADNRRIDRGLSVSHHIAVAALPPERQRELLDRAWQASTKWTVPQLKAAIRDAGEEHPITAWCLFVSCTSERARRRISKMVELEGATVKDVDRHARASVGDVMDSEQKPEPARILQHRNPRRKKP